MPKKGSKKSFVKSVKEKFKRKTHDKTWDSDDETDNSIQSGEDGENEEQGCEIDEVSPTTVSTKSKSSPSESSGENPSSTCFEEQNMFDSSMNIYYTDDKLPENVGDRPNLQRQLSDTTEDHSNIHKVNSSKMIEQNFGPFRASKTQNPDRISRVNIKGCDIISEENEEYNMDDEPTSDYESQCRTLRKNSISDNQENHGIAASRYCYSVPDLHSKELLQNERNRNKPEIVNIIKFSRSREVIVSPSGGVANLNKTAYYSHNSLSEKETMSQRIKERTTKMLRMFDQTEPKVETELFNQGLSYIQRKTHFPLVIFKGSRSGCGFAAKMLFRWYVSKQSKLDSFFLKEADELSILNEKNGAVVLVLDANGGTGNNTNRLDHWFEILKERMPIGSKEHGNLILIISLNDCSKIKHPILKKYSEYVLDADSYHPSTETKEQLVEALMKQNNIKPIPLRDKTIQYQTQEKRKLHFIDTVTSNSIAHFLSSKGCIGELSDFFTKHLSEGLNFFRKPIPQCVRVMRKFHKHGSKSFLSLLAVHALGGIPFARKVHSPNEHNTNNSLEKPWRSMTAIDKLSKAKVLGKHYEGLDVQHLYRFAKENGHQCNIGNSIRKAAHGLVGKFLDKTGEGFKFSNGRIKYSFLLVLYEAYPKAIENCDDDFFFNFIKFRDDVCDEKADTCILIDGKKLDEMTRSICCRFKREMMLKNVAKCMRHPVMCPKFFKIFLKYLNETPHLTWKVLKQTDANEKEEYCSLYYGMTNPLDYGTSENITELVLRKSIWKKKRKRPKWKEFTSLQEQRTLVCASEKSNAHIFRLLVDSGAEISLQTIEKAIRNGSEEIIKIIMENWPTNKYEWTFKAAQYAAVKLSEGNLTRGIVELMRDLIINSSSSKKVLVPTDEPPLIHWIIKENETKALKCLLGDACLNTAVDINTEFNEETPLLAAIRFEHDNIVQLLLQHNAKLGSKEFALASSLGNVTILEHLFQKRPATIFEEDADGLTPLYNAVSYGKIEAVKFILAKSGMIRQSCQANSIQTSCTKQKQMEPDLQTRNIEGQTALHVAAIKGHSEIIDILVIEGFDICAKDRSEDSPISLAYKNKHMPALRCLLKSWRSKSLHVDENVIMQVVNDGDAACLKLMNEFGFKANCTSSTYDAILKESINKGMNDMVRCILSSGGCPNKAIDGWRPIHYAANNGDIDMLKILIEFGADITKKTIRHGDSIIHIGAQRNDVEFIKSVFGMPDSNDLIDIKDSDGNTALHVACKLGHPSLLKSLLEYGFKTELQNKDSLQPRAIVDHQIHSAVKCKDHLKVKCFDDCKKLLDQHRQIINCS